MSLPDNMIAARCLEYGSNPPLQLVRVPLPEPGPREILIKVSAASLCHTDIGMCKGNKRNEGNTIPQTAGHEPCGVIVQLGTGVRELSIGDRVGFINHAGSCGILPSRTTRSLNAELLLGDCEECLDGQNTYCLAANTKLRGVNTDGCFSEYALGDAVYTFKIPNKLSDDQAAPLMCE
jgi:propanol-preferring alcohol dehydrogenase